MVWNNEDAPNYKELPSTNPIASKQYKCWICKKFIEIGEKHIKRVYIDYDVTPPQLNSVREHTVHYWEADNGLS